MFDNFVGKKVKIVFKDGDRYSVEYGVITSCNGGFIMLDTGVAINQETIQKIKRWDK